MPKTCPKCGLICVEGSRRCACGYDLTPLRFSRGWLVLCVLLLVGCIGLYYLDRWAKANQTKLQFDAAYYKGWSAANDRDWQTAAGAFTEAITFATPQSADAAKAHYWRGYARHALKEYPGAIEDFGVAIRLDPPNAEAYKGRGQALGVSKQYDRAIEDFDEVIRLVPDHADAMSYRGAAWLGKKDYDKAVKDWDDAILLDPSYSPAFKNLAWLLATCPEAKYLDGKRAVELAKKACDLSDWKEPGYVRTLAAAYATAGDYEQAVRYEKKAPEFPAYEKQYGQDVRKRVKLYEQKQPFRE